MTWIPSDTHPDVVATTAEQLYTKYNPEARGKPPSVTRAATLYLAYMMEGKQECITQQSLAEEFNCSKSSIRSRMRDIDSALDLSR